MADVHDDLDALISETADPIAVRSLNRVASEIERMRAEIALMHESMAGVYLKGHMDGVESASKEPKP